MPETIRHQPDMLYDPICGYTLRRVREPEDAAEALAETFATLWRRFDSCPQGAELRPWLFRGRTPRHRDIGEFR